MIRKDWYRTMVVEMKEGVDELKEIRGILDEHHIEITDFEVDHAKEGVNMLLRLGLKLRSTKHADQLIEDVGVLKGVSNVKWEIE
jgi:uncharacterized protein with ACT and thioredoxin-like domain